jgi:hypothetical protein
LFLLGRVKRSLSRCDADDSDRMKMKQMMRKMKMKKKMKKMKMRRSAEEEAEDVAAAGSQIRWS